MKRLTITLLTLLMSMGAWAKDEFPIELTCEVGMAMIYLHLEETAEKSWFMFHESSEDLRGQLERHSIKFKDEKGELRRLGQKNPRLNLQKLKTEKGEIKKIDYDLDGRLYVETKPIMGISIQRYSLKVNAWVGGLGERDGFDGQCYKGFKEYEKQI